MLWEGFNTMSCIDCGRKSRVVNSYGEKMCYICHSKFIEEQEDGRRIPKKGSNEGFVD